MLLPKLSHDEDVPDLFWTIFLGANDAALSPSGRASIPLEEFASNLVQMASLLRQHECTSATSCKQTGAPIIFMTPPSCDVLLWRRVHPDAEVPENGNEIYKSYRDRVIQVPQNNSPCSVLDTWSLLGGKDPPLKFTKRDYHTDGVHFTAKGNRVVFQGLMDLIRRGANE